MNITDVIYTYAMNTCSTLDAMATGGGCDFIYKQIDNGKYILIGNNIDGQSPDTLDEPSCMVIYDNWEDGGSEQVVVEFETAKQALDSLEKMPLYKTAIEKNLDDELSGFCSDNDLPCIEVDDLIMEIKAGSHGERPEWVMSYLEDLRSRFIANA